MNATTLRRSLHAITLAMIGSAIALSGATTHDAPQGGWVAHSEAQRQATYADLNSGDVNVPTWSNSDAATQPGAITLGALGSAIPRALVVSNREGLTKTLAYTKANVAAIEHSGRTTTHDDDLYVVGAVR